MRTRWFKVLAVAVSLLAVWLYWYLDGSSVISLQSLKQHYDGLKLQIELAPLRYGIAYFALYLLLTAMSLPGSAVLTLGAGALFGLVYGTLLASLASTMGATCAFLISRGVLRDTVESRWSRQLQAINDGLARDGILYLLTLRLVPAFPFFLINLLLGLTAISAVRFALVSLVGMFPATLFFVYAGTRLGSLSSVQDVMSVEMLVLVSAAGLLPLALKAILTLFRTQRAA